MVSSHEACAGCPLPTTPLCAGHTGTPWTTATSCSRSGAGRAGMRHPSGQATSIACTCGTRRCGLACLIQSVGGGRCRAGSGWCLVVRWGPLQGPTGGCSSHGRLTVCPHLIPTHRPAEAGVEGGVAELNRGRSRRLQGGHCAGAGGGIGGERVMVQPFTRSPPLWSGSLCHLSVHSLGWCRGVLHFPSRGCLS